MKKLNLILAFCILNFCLADTTDECSTKFQEALQSTCTTINTNCRFTDFNKKCIEVGSCGSGNQDTCSDIIPETYNKQKCEYDSTARECKPKDKVCGEYNVVTINGVTITGDKCSDLSPGSGTGIRCALNNNDICDIHYDACTSTSLSDSYSCKNNIPSNPEYECDWVTGSSSCQQVKRKCNNYLKEFATDDYCNALETIDTNKKCVYLNGVCRESYPTCREYGTDSTTCNRNWPLTSDNKAYDFSKRCKFNSETNICEAVSRKCSEYRSSYGDDKNKCLNTLQPEDSNKHCIYDEENDSCYEWYTSCQAYNDNEIKKTRNDCESIILSEVNQRCVFIMEEDKCIKENIYNDCKDYKGSDKKVCESIISPKTNSHCVLEKDLTCNERTFHCSEARNVFDCLIYAKPSDNNKKCAYDSGCYETYKGCEDFEYKNENQCNNLDIINGQNCYYESEKCKSKQKKCSEALTKEECEMIKTSGVSDPDKKICYYGIDSSSSSTERCFEQYKYCSDYRGSVDNICERIQPYDESGNNIDYAYKCKIKNSGVGCEKVPKECGDASNKILCDLVSPVINDNRIKYCLYYEGSCNEEYKTCNDVNEESDANIPSKCNSNIPKEYLNTVCEVSYDNGKPKCEDKKRCDAFNSRDYQNLCININPNCTYDSSSMTCNTIAQTCGNIEFYTESSNNEAICKATQATNVNKICVLRDDRSGCEEVWKEDFPITKANAESSSQILIQNIGFILVFVSLLF